MTEPRTLSATQVAGLLEGTTPGPWEWDEETDIIVAPLGNLPTVLDGSEIRGEDLALVAAAPDLAHTVQVLYGVVKRLADGWTPSATTDNPTRWYDRINDGSEWRGREPMSEAEADVLREVGDG